MPAEAPGSPMTVLVTGASSGIGEALAHCFARDGHRLVLVARRESRLRALAESLCNEHGTHVDVVPTDLARRGAAATLATMLRRRRCAIDVLVNNAGVFLGGKIGEIRPADYEHLMRINVDAVFALTNAAVKHMKPGGRIVNISSILGERATGPDMGVYNASKFAVTGFSRSWAKDLGARGILVNAVQPGPIDTDLNPATGAHAESMRRQTALGRYGRPEEVAAAVAFLAGPDAGYITGATLNVDGGWNA